MCVCVLLRDFKWLILVEVMGGRVLLRRLAEGIGADARDDGIEGNRQIAEPQRRISSCKRPTAFCVASSERKELEQTSSARPSV